MDHLRCACRGHELKDGDAASKPTERAKKVALVQKFMDGALYSLSKHQTDKAEELMKGAIEYLYHDNTIKDKAAKLEEFMKEAIKFLEQDMIEKSEETMKGAIVYLESDDEVKDEQSGKRVKYLENNKVQARVNIVLLVDDFLNEALTYLGAEEIAKAKNVIEGMKLFVSQCDEIKDKAATFEEMIQRALTFIEQGSLEKAKEVINEAMTYLGNDDDVKELRKAEGVKYLEQDKAERGIQKAIFVTEVLKVALTYVNMKQVEKAKEVVEGVEMYVALDDTVKDKVGSTKEILKGIKTLFQLDRVEKAKEAIQGAMTYLSGDEDVQEADKLLKSMGVEEQNKLFKDVKDKTAAKLKRVKFLENGGDGIGKLELVHDFVQGALIFLEKSKTEKAKEMIDGAVMCFHQDDTGKDKEAKFEEFMKEALTYLEQENKAQAEETLKKARDYLVTEDAANDKGSEL